MYGSLSGRNSLFLCGILSHWGTYVGELGESFAFVRCLLQGAKLHVPDGFESAQMSSCNVRWTADTVSGSLCGLNGTHRPADHVTIMTSRGKFIRRRVEIGRPLFPSAVANQPSFMPMFRWVFRIFLATPCVADTRPSTFSGFL